MAVKHIVYFGFKQDASPVAINQHMEMFAALANTISGITDYSAGHTFKVDYESTADYDVLHCVTCESRLALEAYFHHPAHQAFIEANKAIWQDVMVVNADV
jgi:hypothetical protein